MGAVETRNTGLAASGCYVNEGTIKVISKTISVKTDERMQLVNITDEFRSMVEAAGIRDGFAQLSCLHTTAALFVNEWQDALLADVKSMLENIVPQSTYYRHNDPEFSDCDRMNAHSHLRNIVLGLSLSIPVSQGELVLGRWQSVILAEFDGPNERKVFIQVFGI